MSREPRWDRAEAAQPGSPAAAAHAALQAFNAAVMAMSALDPVTTELVRLRCARTHDCRLCMATRSVASIRAGMDDSLAAKVDAFEASDLDERHKVALRLTDAMIGSPGPPGESVLAAAHAHFSDVELAELCLYVVKFSSQKIGVSLGTDGTDSVPTDAQGRTFVEYHPDGALKGFTAVADRSGA